MGLIVFDEIHLISDGSRGSVIEDFIANVLYYAGASTRILGLSATIGNPLELCDFLGGGTRENCFLHLESRRPIKIEEHLVVAGSAMQIVRDDDGRGKIVNSGDRSDILHSDDVLLQDEDSLSLSHDEKVAARLIFDCMQKHERVLVFCNTRNRCVSVCASLTKAYTLLYRY